MSMAFTRSGRFSVGVATGDVGTKCFASRYGERLGEVGDP
jgi:hypothetical protein